MVILIYVKKDDFLRAAYGQFTGYIMDVFHHVFNRLVDISGLKGNILGHHLVQEQKKIQDSKMIC